MSTTTIAVLALASGVLAAGCGSGVAREGGSDGELGAAASALTNPPGLTHDWEFDEPSGTTAIDSVGGSNGTLEGDATRVPGYTGGGIGFDGNADVSFDPSIAGFGTADFTVGFWINTTAQFDGYYFELLSNRHDGSGGNFFSLRFLASGLTLELDDNVNYVADTVPGAFNDGAWHHVVARRQGTTSTLFVDCASTTNGTAGVTDILADSPFLLGSSPIAYDFGNNYSYEGDADDLQIWGRALSDSEVTSYVPCGATCVTFQRGVNGAVIDSAITPQSPTLNFGTAPVANVGTNPGTGVENQLLLEFDVSSIPSNAVVVSATATVTQMAYNASTFPWNLNNPGTVDVHQVTAPWAESTVTWSSFGEAYDPTVVSSFVSTLGGSPTPPLQAVSFDLTALAPGWVSGATPNYGILLDEPVTDVTSVQTSDNGNTSLRPALTVCYTAP
jgi:hypothetical protein